MKELNSSATRLKAERIDNGCSFHFSIDETGYYRIVVKVDSVFVKEIRRFPVLLNDLACAEVSIDKNGGFQREVRFVRYLIKNQYRIYIENSIEFIKVSDCHITRVDGPDASVYDIRPILVTEHPHPNSQRLMNYLCDVYGKCILTGQQRGEENSKEINTVYDSIGKYPAIKGFDFISYSSSRVKRGEVTDQTEEAVNWWNEGGIVTFCWHWNAPKDLVDTLPDKSWNRGFYTYATTFDIEHAMSNPESGDFKLLLDDIDTIAGQLKKLEAEGVPVLFRPLHEAAGGWFWWGAKGEKPCLALWKLMFERLTGYHGLSNLIWVWSGLEKSWYPGDDYVDIIGDDVYAGTHIHTSQADRFLKCLSIPERRKIVTLSENGSIPDPDELLNDNVRWSWFCTWHGIFTYRNINGKTALSEEFTCADVLKKVYEHPFAISRADLPDLRSYRL